MSNMAPARSGGHQCKQVLSRRELHRINIDMIRRSKSSGNTIRSDDTTYLIRLTAMIDDPYLPIESESSTMDVEDRQERAGVYIRRFRNRHKLSPDSAGAMFCSHHCRRRPPLLDKGRLCHIWLSPDAKQVERHHFLLANRCAIITFFFDFFDFSILNPRAGHPSTTARSFDILIPIVAHHGLSNAPERVFTRDLLYRCRYIAVAQIWTFGERKLGKKLGILGQAEQGGTRAMDDLIGRWMDRWSIR